MKIQYINNKSETEFKKNYEEHEFTFNNFSEPFSPDDFDINIIDLNSIWNNSKSEEIFKMDIMNNIHKMTKSNAEIMCSYRCIENWLLYFFDNFSTGSMDSNAVKTRLIKVSNGKYKSETDFDEEFFYNNLPVP